jgi:hypothetical protein
MKARPSKLDEHAEDLCEWFDVEKLTLKGAVARLAERGVKVSGSRLSTWWGQVQQQRLEDQILANIATGSRLNRDIQQKFEKDAPPDIETIKKLLQTLVLHVTVKGQGDPKFFEVATSLLDRVLSIEEGRRKGLKLQLDERRVQLLERKAAQAEAAERVIDETLSAEEKLARMRQIFGMPPK